MVSQKRLFGKMAIYLPSNSFKQQQHMEQVFLSIQVMKRLQNIKGMHIVISEIYPSFQGDFQLLASFSQSFLLKFWKSQYPWCSKYPEFSKTPPTFAFWMSLKVVMAVFPLNDIFFGTRCISVSFVTEFRFRSMTRHFLRISFYRF